MYTAAQSAKAAPKQTPAAAQLFSVHFLSTKAVIFCRKFIRSLLSQYKFCQQNFFYVAFVAGGYWQTTAIYLPAAVSQIFRLTCGDKLRQIIFRFSKIFLPIYIGFSTTQFADYPKTQKDNSAQSLKAFLHS